MRCFVTGATGHIGATLTRYLLAAGCPVAVLVRPDSNLWRLSDVIEEVTIIQSEMGTGDELLASLKRWKPDAVFHLAWQGVTGGFRNDISQITRNISGSLEVFEASHKAGSRCWIGMGSQAEYGPQDGLLREEMAASPQTAYGTAKLCSGMLTQKLCEMTGIRFLWLRLLATYGPMDDPRHLLPAVIDQLLKGERPSLTAGEQRWDYLYIDDAVEAIARLALETQQQGIFNLGSGNAETVRAIVEQARDLISPSLPLGFGEIPYRPDQIMHLQADISKLHTATGWSPQIGLVEGLQRTIAWHRDRKEIL